MIARFQALGQNEREEGQPWSYYGPQLNTQMMDPQLPSPTSGSGHPQYDPKLRQDFDDVATEQRPSMPQPLPQPDDSAANASDLEFSQPQKVSRAQRRGTQSKSAPKAIARGPRKPRVEKLRPYHCVVRDCKNRRGFERHADLRRHLHYVHGIGDPALHSCPECPKTCKRKDNLKS